MSSDGYNARSAVVARIIEILRGLSGRRYFVHNGPVAWDTFDFESHPFGAALIQADFPLWQPEGIIHSEAVFSIELVTALPPQPAEAVPGLSEGVIDQLASDASTVLLALRDSLDSQNDPVVFGIFDPRARIMVNGDWMVQGLDVSFRLRY